MIKPFKWVLTILLLVATVLGHAQQPVQPDPAALARFGDYQGSVVLVDFWASWCGPCRRSFPWMNDLQRRYGDADLKVIAINVDANRADADRFLQKYPAQFEVWFDPQGTLAESFGVSTMPMSFLLDRNGNLRRAHRGFLTQNIPDYQAEIQNLIDNKEI